MPIDTSAPNNHYGINLLDFNNGELNITRQYQDTDFYLTNASMSDAEGGLLFTSNGCKVFQTDGKAMENGNGLNPGVVWETGHCPQGGNAIFGGTLALPLPNSNDSIFYLFHGSLVWGDGPSPYFVYDGILYYTVVDMTQNNELGKVIEKNQIVLSDTLFNAHQAVRHANGTDWWLISASAHKNTYYTTLFTADGVAGIFEQGIGPDSDPKLNGGFCFSPNGERFARYDKSTHVLLFDFDRATGQLSNVQQFVADTAYTAPGATLSFSPSGRFLYVASDREIYQFDLEAADIQASRVLLDVYDGFKFLDIFPASFGFMQLAPDCKIYMSTRSSTPFYHVINYPDRKGLECGFVQRGLPLIATNAGSIPNFPNYRLGTGHPVCDSTIQLVVSSIPVLPPVREVLVYPNPASNYITIEIPQPLASGGEWSLYNGVGQRVVLQEVARGATRLEVALAGVPPGLYFWEMQGGEGRMGSGKLVIND